VDERTIYPIGALFVAIIALLSAFYGKKEPAVARGPSPG